MCKASSPTNDHPDIKRDRHGHRGLPPPATFDFEALADCALLSEIEVAAILKISTNTVGSWRRQPDHPLKWLALPNGFVRYTAGHVREYLARGMPRRPRGRPPAMKADAAPKPKPPKRKPGAAGTLAAITEISHDAAPPRRRAPRRPRTADAAAPAEPAS